jgi:hypothetical protein
MLTEVTKDFTNRTTFPSSIDAKELSIMKKQSMMRTKPEYTISQPPPEEELSPPFDIIFLSFSLIFRIE